MSNINLIAAMDYTGIIGIDGYIPWYCPEDLKRFKTLTEDGIVIMGKKTVLSLPKKLQNRTVISISHNDYETDKCDLQVFSCEKAIDEARIIQRRTNKTIWIAGGGEIYTQMFKAFHIQNCYITYVPPVDIKAEDLTKKFTYFPSDFMLDRFTVESFEQSNENEKILYAKFGLKSKTHAQTCLEKKHPLYFIHNKSQFEKYKQENAKLRYNISIINFYSEIKTINNLIAESLDLELDMVSVPLSDVAIEYLLSKGFKIEIGALCKHYTYKKTCTIYFN